MPSIPIRGQSKVRSLQERERGSGRERKGAGGSGRERKGAEGSGMERGEREVGERERDREGGRMREI